MRATTYEEVSSGALSSTRDRFDIAIDLTLSSLQDLRRGGQLVGAIVFGSAFTGDSSHESDLGPLSDLDVLAVTTGDQYAESLRLLGDMTTRVLGSSAVSLEVTWMTEKQAREDDHTITIPMRDWLKRQVGLHPETVVGRDPTELVGPIHFNLEEYTDEWFCATQNRFQKASLVSHQVLPWALDLPHIAGRRSIDALKYTNRAGQSVVPPLDVTREGVRLAVRDIYGQHNPKLWELYQTIERRKRAFVSFLMDEVSTGNVSRDSYDATIDETARETVPEVLELLSSMHDAFWNVGYTPYDDAYRAQVTEANMRTPTYEHYMIIDNAHDTAHPLSHPTP